MSGLKFRKLRASEIEARVAQVNRGGVSILLYKDARVDMNLLDETVGPMNWQKSYSRDNANCVISIWDDEKKQWISKEDTGTESYTEKEKGLASDSFKRAGFAWGIGRELYTAPQIFFWGKDLRNFREENGKYTDRYDRFSVSGITYTENGMIKTVTVEVSDAKGVYLKKTFGSAKAAKVEKELEKSEKTEEKAPEEKKETAAAKQTEKKPAAKKGGIKGLPDDEVILVGNAKGKTFGEVKNTAPFLSYLKMAATAESRGFETEAEQEQYAALKKLGQQIYGSARKSA